MKDSLMESEVRSSKMGKGSGAERSEKSKKTPPYLTMVPAALMKFSNASKKNKNKSVVAKKPQHPASGEHVEGSCRLGCCIFHCCQRFNNIRCFLILYCLLVMSQGIVFGLTALSTHNFQRNYNVKNIEKLALITTYDVSSALVALFVAFYGGRGNRPKWIAASAFLIGLGSLLMAFPYLNVEHIQLEEEIEDICDPKKEINYCLRSGSYQQTYVTFFIIGQTLQGIGGMPLYILGVTYLDDSVPIHLSGMYLGIADCSSILGYGLGYTLGAPLLKTLENNTSQTSHTNDDGSNLRQKIWSLDFTIASVIAWSTLIPFSCFPQSIPGTARIRSSKRKQSHLSDNKLKDWTFGPNIRDFCYTIWIVMKNPVFMCQALSKAAESLLLIGASEFLPIYLENQFLLTPRLSATLTGIILIPGGALGQLLGGIIVSKLEMSCKALMRFVIITSSLSLIFLGCIIFVHCDSAQFAGISEDYDGTGQLGNLTAPCNLHCQCSSSLYFSICGRDDIEYFSPCFAGCTLVKKIHDEKAYYNCSCIKSGLTTADEDNDFPDAKPGKCDTKCYTLPLFFSFMFSAIVFSSFSAVPLNLIIFRVTPEKLHSLALGISYVTLRILGTIPGPIVFKSSGENSCTFRDINKCGRTGHCWVYNKTKMAYLLIGICAFCKVFTVVLSVTGFYKYNYSTRENTDVQPVPIKNENPKKIQRGKNSKE